MQHLSIFLRPTLSLSGHQGDRRRTCSGAWRNAAPEVAQRRALFDAMVAAPTPQPSQPQQQQHYYELPIPLVSHPRSKFRGAFTKPSASVDSAQSGSHGGGRVGGWEGGRSRHPTRVPSAPARAHAPTTHQPHCASTNAPALFKFGLAHNARA